MTRIRKKGFAAPTEAKQNSPGKKVDTSTSTQADTYTRSAEPELEHDEAESDEVEILFDAENSTATGTLANGYTLTVKEPKTKKLIHYASRLEDFPPHYRTGSMSMFLLTYLMLSSVECNGVKIPIPVFDSEDDEDSFMDWLQDADAKVVGALFACFPDIGARISSVLTSIMGSTAD